MKIKEAKYKSCKSCKRTIKMISDEIYGCDWCKKSITLNVEGKNHQDYLGVVVFEEWSTSEHYQFCSWKCVFKFIPTIKSGYFASLPHLNFENDIVKGQHFKDFVKLIKKIRN